MAHQIAGQSKGELGVRKPVFNAYRLGKCLLSELQMSLLQVGATQELEGLRIVGKKLSRLFEMSDSAHGVVGSAALLALLKLVLGFRRDLGCARVYRAIRPFWGDVLDV